MGENHRFPARVIVGGDALDLVALLFLCAFFSVEVCLKCSVRESCYRPFFISSSFPLFFRPESLCTDEIRKLEAVTTDPLPRALDLSFRFFSSSFVSNPSVTEACVPTKLGSW